MEIVLLNGFELDQTPVEKSLNGFRVNPVNGYDDMYNLNGFRVNPINGMSDDYNLNGFRVNPINGYELNGVPSDEELELWMYDVQAGDPVAINGLKDWLARRRAKKAVKQDQRVRTREARILKKETAAAGGGFGSKLLELGKGFIDSKSGVFDEVGLSVQDSLDEAKRTMITDPDSVVNKKFLGMGKSWWEKRSTVEKGMIIGGGVVTLSLIGLLIYKLTSKKKKKR